MKRRKVGYYHIYLSDDYGSWSSIFMEQFKYMEDSGLLDALDLLKIYCITQDDHRNLAISSLCQTQMVRETPLSIELNYVRSPWKNDEEMIVNINDERTVTENFTYRKIWNDCQNEDMDVLYFHSKGITSSINFLERTVDAQRFKNYYYWRQFLNWGVLRHWWKCVNALRNGNDVAGVNFYTHPAPHFSGSFWWATSEYIRKLPDPATKEWWYKLKASTTDNWLKGCPDRFRDEQWLCSDPGVRVYKVIDMDEESNPAAAFLPSVLYNEKE